MTAFACAKVSVKGKRHWYKAVEQTGFVALSDDAAWIIRTNGDLYLQTGNFLSDRTSHVREHKQNKSESSQIFFYIAHIFPLWLSIES